MASEGSPDYDYNYPSEKLEQVITHLALSTGSRRDILLDQAIVVPFLSHPVAPTENLPPDLEEEVKSIRAQLRKPSLTEDDAHTIIKRMCTLAFRLAEGRGV